MGTLSAMDMVEQNGVNDQTLLWHLQGNHYPPLPSYMLPIAKKAIHNANKGLYNKRIRLPKEVNHTKYGKLVPTFEVIEHMHLEWFLNQDEMED